MAFFKNSPEFIFKRIIKASFISSIVLFVMGLVLVFLPQISNKIVGVIVGISFIVNSLGTIYNYLHREGAKIYSLNILFGVLFAILGVILIIYPYTLAKFVSICLGIYLLINGAKLINHAVWFKIGNEACWLVTLVSGILYIIFGVLVLLNLFESTMILTQVAGVFLMVNGAIDFTNTLMYKNRTEEIIDIFW